MLAQNEAKSTFAWPRVVVMRPTRKASLWRPTLVGSSSHTFRSLLFLPCSCPCTDYLAPRCNIRRTWVCGEWASWGRRKWERLNWWRHLRSNTSVRRAQTQKLGPARTGRRRCHCPSRHHSLATLRAQPNFKSGLSLSHCRCRLGSELCARVAYLGCSHALFRSKHALHLGHRYLLRRRQQKHSLLYLLRAHFPVAVTLILCLSLWLSLGCRVVVCFFVPFSKY